MSVAVRVPPRTAAEPRAAARPRASVRRLAAEQAGVAAAQVAAGVGNAAFALIAAHVLAPGGFADLAAFLALYLLVHVPASSASAGSALDAAMAARVRRRVLAGGAGLGVLVAAAGAPLAPLLGLPSILAVVLGLGVPAALPLALERGRLYGARRHRRAGASLLVEPAVRLAAGVPLAALGGAPGAACAVVMGGWAALAVAAGGERPRRTRAAAAGHVGAGTGIAIAAFLGLALVQNQDVLLANALLGDAGAGRFAVLSTLGGVAAFATTTIPLVLLPRAQGGERGALAAALGAAAALGLAAVGVVAVAPGTLVALGFGERFRAVAPLVAPYVGAMALLGIARVLVAQGCARGAGRRLPIAVGAVAALHALLIVALARTPGAVAACTFAAAALLVAAAAATAGGVVVPLPVRARAARPQAASPRPRVPRLPADRRALLAVAVVTALGLAIRLVMTRGLWLDEATSVTQARMPLGAMLHNLRTTDVHPPLHHLVLWATVHLFGTQELVVRLPSIVAGTALIPVLWLTGRELYGPRAGLAAAVLGAVAPFAVWYSQEARMYGFFMLFATVALLAQLRAMRTGQARWWVAFALSGAALVASQYFAVFPLAVLHAATALQLLAAHRRGEPVRARLLGWAGALALTTLLLAPLVPFAHDQFATNQASGRGFDQSPSRGGADVSTNTGPGVYTALTNVVWALWGYHSGATMAALTALWPALMLLALLLLGRGRPGRSGLVAAVAFLPALAMTVLGEAKPFLFEPRYFIALTPMVLLLLARASTGWTASRTGAIVATGALAATLGLATADEQLNRSNPRIYDFQGALQRIDQRAHPGDVVLYNPDYLGDLVHYIDPGVRARPLARGVPPAGRGDHRRQVFVLASFLDERQHAMETARGLTALQRSGRRQVAQFRRPQVKVWIYR